MFQEQQSLKASSRVFTSTERLNVRRFSTHDLPAFQAYRTDDDLARFQGWAPWTDEEALNFIEEMGAKEIFLPGEWIQLAIEDVCEGCLIGDIGLFISDDCRESKIGYTLRKASHGKGFAIEAVKAVISMVFAKTTVQKILAITDRRNIPSVRLLERIGMVKVSFEEVEFKGEWCVEDTYCLSRNEFFEI